MGLFTHTFIVNHTREEVHSEPDDFPRQVLRIRLRTLTLR
jgi:hypothetical protein